MEKLIKKNLLKKFLSTCLKFMKKELLKKKIKKIIKGHFNITKGDSIRILSADNINQWDSLGHLTLISKIEKEFKISFSQNEAATMLDEKKIYSTILKKWAICYH